jgi:CysZ protein
MASPPSPPGSPPGQPVALATRPAAAPPERPGFGAGLRAFFGGIGFVVGNPSVWPLAMVPVVIATALTALLAWAGASVVPPFIASLIGPTTGTLGAVLTTIAQVAATLLALVLALLLGFGLAQPLSGPALERLVRRVEASVGAPTWPPTSVLSDMGRSLQSVIVGYAFGLPLLAILFVVDLVFAPAVVVTVPLKLLVTAMLLAWDVCDYPLSIRGVSIGTRVAFMKRNASAMIGFGIGLAIAAVVPCLLVFVLPFGVAGAARLTNQIERFEGTHLR